jgi:hypothetical protein
MACPYCGEYRGREILVPKMKKKLKAKKASET